MAHRLANGQNAVAGTVDKWSLELTLAGVRAKPSPGRARMVWTTLEGDLVG